MFCMQHTQIMEPFQMTQSPMRSCDFYPSLCTYSELTGSKNENIQVILSEIQEIDQNVHQVPQDLPQSFCFRDVRRHDRIKSLKSKTGKII